MMMCLLAFAGCTRRDAGHTLLQKVSFHGGKRFNLDCVECFVDKATVWWRRRLSSCTLQRCKLWLHVWEPRQMMQRADDRWLLLLGVEQVLFDWDIHQK